MWKFVVVGIGVIIFVLGLLTLFVGGVASFFTLSGLAVVEVGVVEVIVGFFVAIAGWLL
jgi:hypothetical protein